MLKYLFFYIIQLENKHFWVSVMNLVCKKKLNKLALLLLEALSIAVVFAIAFYSEAVILFKDILSRLSFSSDIEELIYRILLPLKMLINTPSLCAVFFLVIHILCMTNNKCFWFIAMLLPLSSDSEDIFEQNRKTSKQFFAQKNYSYLENMRLLF